MRAENVGNASDEDVKVADGGVGSPPHQQHQVKPLHHYKHSTQGARSGSAAPRSVCRLNIRDCPCKKACINMYNAPDWHSGSGGSFVQAQSLHAQIFYSIKVVYEKLLTKILSIYRADRPPAAAQAVLGAGRKESMS